MFFKKTVWIIIFIVFHTVFFMQSAYSDNQTYPTYSKFLKKFPNGYPKFSGPGDSKSMGAFKLYLEDLGFKTFENTGFEIIVLYLRSFPQTRKRNDYDFAIKN